MSAGLAEPVEIEVKLGVARPRRIARLIREFEGERLAGFEPDGPVVHVTHTDRYLDTDAVDGALAADGVRVRLRRHGRTVTLGLKRAGAERDGVTTRTELEAPAVDALDPRRWPASEARAAVLDALGQGFPAGTQLVEIARLRQRRLTRLIRRGATRVELSLDRVDALLDGAVAATRHELEAELKSGAESDLAELATALAHVPGLEPPGGSKLSFGRSVR